MTVKQLKQIIANGLRRGNLLLNDKVIAVTGEPPNERRHVIDGWSATDYGRRLELLGDTTKRCREVVARTENVMGLIKALRSVPENYTVGVSYGDPPDKFDAVQFIDHDGINVALVCEY